MAKYSQGAASMMQRSNNGICSIDVRLLFDCCPIDVRYIIEDQTNMKRTTNEQELEVHRSYYEPKAKER